MAQAFISLGSFGDVNIGVGVVDTPDDYQDVIKNFHTVDKTWVVDGTMSSQVFVSSETAVCLIKVGKGLTEDEIGKLLETICSGYYKDLAKRYGEYGSLGGLNPLSFSGYAADAILKLIKDNNMV